MNPFCLHRLLDGIAVALVLTAGSVPAQTPVDEEEPWPRVRSANGNTVTLHLPQVESWTSNSFKARAAVAVKPASAKKELLGVIWLEAHGQVDRANRIVTLDRLEITKARFPEAPDQGSNALAIVRELFPSGARTVSLDYLIAALGFEQAAARQGPGGLKHTPPEIIWATNRAVLVLVDGEPVLRPITNTPLERVINTPALLVREQANGKFYLAGDGQWFAAGTLKGPWSLAQNPPPAVAALLAAAPSPSAQREEVPAARIIVSTSPAELLMTGGLPDYRPIRGTALQYAADTDSQLFFHTTDREAYLLLSGRWFKAKSLNGPWSHVAPRDLPADFARIPPGSAQAVVLASVPDTPQAELAVVANAVPTTATVNRQEAKIQLAYDGAPQFKPIDGTPMSYAINAQLPVIQTGDKFYALDNGVWFTAAAPAGPWEVATEVPEEIYTIPPSSPVYYATFVRVYQATGDEVEVGYTPGYQGAYEDDGTVVYGTGWDYDSWTGEDYYGWGWTWGYSYVYVPWYQWWLWRPWWSQPGGLRAALVENIYDRWQERPGVIHHDRPATVVARPAAGSGVAGHPALYGRFKGTARTAPMNPPPNTLAVNPYARPQAPTRSGEIPRGAQLLTTIRQSPGGGRDLYASPDGSIYLRKSDGWYRRQSGGSWSYYAPTQGEMAMAPGVKPADGIYRPSAAGVYKPRSGTVYKPGPSSVYKPGASSVYKPDASSVYKPGAKPAVPDTGYQPPQQEVAALERQYYARSLGQMRAQNWRPPRNIARPVRGGVRRR